jgi:hypothetical protein
LFLLSSLASFAALRETAFFPRKDAKLAKRSRRRNNRSAALP